MSTGTGLSADLAASAPRAPATAAGRVLRVPCTVEMAHTADDCYAHAFIDEVLVHGAPTRIAWGERLRVEREATVARAGRLARLWTRLTARFELGLLYEVSFSSRRFSPKRPYPRPPRTLP